MTKAIASLRHFAHVHDDLPAFHAGYLVLTILVAALFNLGAFALLIVAHMTLDFVKYREHHHFTLRRTWEGIVRESLVDVALLTVGVVFSVYLHHTVGLASISGLLRAEMSVVRAAAILVPKVKILHHFLKVVSHVHHYMDQIHPKFSHGWSALDKFCFGVIVVSVALVVFSPVLMHVSTITVLRVLEYELIPFRF
ncbi:hypothetical protein COU78_02575 [Candidatus Peregrinibacteria bacterium CG10_big_fil_rev_8_21_14_0_10_49_24]|nr:MAG: hypothetical protein COV83_02555 [Candidatus Peregrinibacteria bacterium CG11_big_fil_rev_8_21_14_0_20_49_14]PIR51022.1 MAG: hypothetical protein COU78_02575 [Candidatus Peregrinibacteria bacterium CG10_big_fil_rev_8_21_14_0_10_49_24]PJA67575.1 MAG: hypothetical protein CO157_04055 [Candidatus Peregrinibacteria bacterium CG_4_9_14_3_um_filter_49_12]